MTIAKSVGVVLTSLFLLRSAAVALPPGFVMSTIPLNGTPVGFAFDSVESLFALEGAPFGTNDATLRVFAPDGTPMGSFSVQGDDPTNFFVGGMAYDPVGDQILISDNTTDGRLYTVSKTGAQHTLATGIPGIAGIAVRATGQIFVSAAPFGSPGAVYQIDRATGAKTEVLPGLALGAGLALDGGDLIVQDAILNTSTFETRGRLKRLPITGTSELAFGPAIPLLDNMNSGYSVAVDGDGDLFTTGTGGLYEILGVPPAEVSRLASGFSAALAFDGGPFEPFAGLAGGRLALAAEASFGTEDQFITIVSPAEPGDYNSDRHIDAQDYDVWRGAFGVATADADGNLDGVVDAADYLIWRKHSSDSQNVFTGSSIPEPTTIAGLLTAALLASTARARRQRRPTPGA